MLVFPTSRGRFFQWEDFRMFDALAQHLEEGWLQFFCVDGIDNETWYDFERVQTSVLEMHQAYDRYLLEEFLPAIEGHNQNPFLMVTGASFGAFQAANFAFRHPHKVRRLLAMSGDYCIRKYLDDYYDTSVYFNNPVDYLPLTHAPDILGALRSMDIILAAGQSDFCLPPTLRLSGILRDLGVPHRCEVWGQDAIHDWPTWKKMVRAYL